MFLRTSCGVLFWRFTAEMTEANTKNITAQRKGHKSYATKIMNEVDALIISTYNQDDKVKIITYIQVLTERCDTIQTLDNKILETLTEDEQIENEVMTSGDYHMRLQRTLVALTDALKKLSDNDSSTTDNITPSTIRHDHAKLPKLQLKSFSGEVLFFQEFWESYNSAIHCNEKLDKVTKFNYFRFIVIVRKL